MSAETIVLACGCVNTMQPDGFFNRTEFCDGHKPLFQQFADSGATEFPIRDRFPTKDDGPGGAIRLAPPDELRKREVLDEIAMAKRFGPVRPPAGLCGRTEVCETCPSQFLCTMKAHDDAAGRSYSKEIREAISRVGGPESGLLEP